MSKEEIERRFSLFRKIFDEQRKVKYDYEYVNKHWRFYYTLIIDNDTFLKSIPTHIEIEKLNDPDLEFKKLVNHFKKRLHKNEGVEWYWYTCITKNMFTKYKLK